MIHRQLIEKGMNVSYSSVCKYIARKKSEKTDKTKEAYLRIHREPGAECEFETLSFSDSNTRGKSTENATISRV